MLFNTPLYRRLALSLVPTLLIPLHHPYSDVTVVNHCSDIQARSPAPGNHADHESSDLGLAPHPRYIGIYLPVSPSAVLRIGPLFSHSLCQSLVPIADPPYQTQRIVWVPTFLINNHIWAIVEAQASRLFQGVQGRFLGRNSKGLIFRGRRTFVILHRSHANRSVLALERSWDCAPHYDLPTMLSLERSA